MAVAFALKNHRLDLDVAADGADAADDVVAAAFCCCILVIVVFDEIDCFEIGMMSDLAVNRLLCFVYLHLES